LNIIAKVIQSVWDKANNLINVGLKSGSAIIGSVSIDQTTPGTTNKVNATNSTHDDFNCNSNLQVNDTDVSNNNPVQTLDRESMGKNGGIVIDDTDAHIGTFTAILCLEEAVVTVTGDITMSSLTIPAQTVIPFDFTSITLASGVVIVFGVES
jgi:hypothetical protein